VSDFNVSFVSGVIPSGQSTNDQTCAVNDVSRAFFLPACYPHTTTGIGRTTGSMNDGLSKTFGLPTLIDNDTVRFEDDGATSGVARNNQQATWLVEYRGPSNGPNAVVLRGAGKMNIANGASTVDSNAITGISDITKCVVFAYGYGTHNSNVMGLYSVHADLVDTGTAIVVRAKRATSSASDTVVAYRVMEFTGSNWTIQKVAHTFAASSTNEDATISSVSPNNSFVVTSSMHPINSANNDLNTFYIWQPNATTLRHRLKTRNASVPLQTLSWVISNPQLRVTRFGVVDGVADFTAVGDNNADSKTIPIDGLPQPVDATSTAIIGYMGSEAADSTAVPAIMTQFSLPNLANVLAKKSTSHGNSEYTVQVLDFSSVVSPRIDGVSLVQDGQSFTITGAFSPGTPTVTHKGEAVTVTANNSTTITCTASLGTKKYGTSYPLVVVDPSGVQLTTDVPMSPAAGTLYTDLAPGLLDSTLRLTASADLDGSEQIRWTDPNVNIFSNGAFRALASVSSFTVSVNDGTGWSASATETLQSPVLPPSITTALPDYDFLYGDEVQINFGNYAAGWTSITVNGTSLLGLTFDGALLKGTALFPGVVALTVHWTNSAGSVSDTALLTVEAPIPPPEEPPPEVPGTTFPPDPVGGGGGHAGYDDTDRAVRRAQEKALEATLREMYQRLYPQPTEADEEPAAVEDEAPAPAPAAPAPKVATPGTAAILKTGAQNMVSRKLPNFDVAMSIFDKMLGKFRGM